MRFTVEGLPPSPNALNTKHWTYRARMKVLWGNNVTEAAQKKRIPAKPYKKAHIMFKIFTGDKRRHDPDNLAWSVTKPALDALVNLGVLEDDTIDHVTLEYEYSRDKPRRFEVEVTKEK